MEGTVKKRKKLLLYSQEQLIGYFRCAFALVSWCFKAFKGFVLFGCLNMWSCFRFLQVCIYLFVGVLKAFRGLCCLINLNVWSCSRFLLERPNERSCFLLREWMLDL